MCVCRRAAAGLHASYGPVAIHAHRRLFAGAAPAGLFLKTAKSSKSLHDMAGQLPWPADGGAYELLEDCGRGVSATVYRAYCRSRDEVSMGTHGSPTMAAISA